MTYFDNGMNLYEMKTGKREWEITEDEWFAMFRDQERNPAIDVLYAASAHYFVPSWWRRVKELDVNHRRYLRNWICSGTFVDDGKITFQYDNMNNCQYPLFNIFHPELNIDGEIIPEEEFFGEFSTEIWEYI